jgi:hypothetical protein
MTIALPQPRTPAQAEAARVNGACSRGPVTAEGKARSALNGVRHGLCSPRFFLLPDEDPAEYAAFRAATLQGFRPRDEAEGLAAERIVQAGWRAGRADRLEALVLADLFAAEALAEGEARTARAAAMRALGTLLRYRARLERERDRAVDELAALKQRPRARPPAPTEPAAAPPAFTPRHGVAFEPARAVEGVEASSPADGTNEPERLSRPLNRHERRRLAALERRLAQAA